MPRADEDLTIPIPLTFPTCRGIATHLAANWAGAYRSVLMRANVDQSMQIAIDVEHSDFLRADLNDLVRTGRKVTCRPDGIFDRRRCRLLRL